MTLCGLCLQHRLCLAHLGNDLHVIRTALHAHPALDAHTIRCLHRRGARGGLLIAYNEQPLALYRRNDTGARVIDVESEKQLAAVWALVASSIDE